MNSNILPAAKAERAMRGIEATTPGETTARIVQAFNRMNGQGEQRAFVAAIASRLAMRICELT
ncbi:hypothetical protein BDI01nite_34090 [Brevundimonas diminuta]|nr:hypothetical protein BDI01nite_34090 [Brevundimonas diminuta]